MKKILFFVAVFLFLSIYASASSYKFVWDESSTLIEVPLNGNVLNYTSIPKATLYKDGQLLGDSEINYITTGDWLFLLTDVDTTKVGDYQVWYKAVETKYKPGQCQGYKVLVTFRVKDLEAPVILEYPPQLTHRIGADKPNYKDYIRASDNSGEYQLLVYDEEVDYHTPGSYKVKITATDGFQSTEVSISLLVEDSLGPIITFLGENNTIRLTVGDAISLKSYFKAVDSVDGDVTNTLSYPSFTTNKADDFPLRVTFSDHFGNESFIDIRIEIVNNADAEIILYQSSLVMDYLTNFQTYDFKANIKSATFGKADIRSDVLVRTSGLKNEVGKGYIQYYYESQNVSKEVECAIQLLSYQEPQLSTQNLTIEVGQKPNYKEFITITDPSDLLIASNLEIDDSGVDYTKAGTYPVVVSVCNSSGLSTTQTFYVTIQGKVSDVVDYKYILIGVLAIGFLGLLGYLIYTRKKADKLV